MRFIATDSAGTPKGQLYPADYSVRQNLASDIIMTDPLMIELFDKEGASLALVDWRGNPAGTWTDAIIIIGDPSCACIMNPPEPILYISQYIDHFSLT